MVHKGAIATIQVREDEVLGLGISRGKENGRLNVYVFGGNWI